MSIKKIGCVVLILLFVFGGMGYLLPFRGAWIDRAVSDFLSKKFRFGILCKSTELRHWSKVSFQSMALGFEGSANKFLESGSGQIYRGNTSSWFVQLRDVRPTKNFPGSRFFSSLPIAKGFEGTALVREITASIHGQAADGFIRVFKCQSDDFVLKGG